MGTVRDLVLARAGDDHPALLFEDRAWTWSEFVDESVRAAGALRALRRADAPFHVGVLLDNVPEYLFLIAGAALAGATVVGVNPTRRGAELARDVVHTDCVAVVVDDAYRDLLTGLEVPPVADLADVLPSTDAHPATTPSPTGSTGGSGAPGEEPVSERDLLLLLFTSGSTAAPKAVRCTQGRLHRTSTTVGPRFGLTRDDVLYQSMPLFHGNALMANWLPALALGATVALRRRFSASGFLPDVRRFRATYFNYVGRAVAYVLATPPSPEDADNALRFGFGTEASPRDRTDFEHRFGCPLVETYGSSEGILSMHCVPGTPDGALGKPLPGIDAAVVDPATGVECPPAMFDANGALVNGDEAIGELVNRDPGDRFEGYYANPQAAAERLRGGWYWSGDLAYRDADGFFWFAGRDADWLRVDSENFAAAPVERILARYPPVVMVAVYPVPDPVTGDRVMAAIELGEGTRFDPDDFADFLAAQPDLGTKWAPHAVRIVDRMPLTANNKVDKKPLRAEGERCAGPLWHRPGRALRYEAGGSLDGGSLLP